MPGQKPKALSIALLSLCLLVLPLIALAQEQTREPDRTPPQHPLLTHACFPGCWFHHLLTEHSHLWRSPFRLQRKDTREALTFGGITTGLLLGDPRLSRASTTQEQRGLARFSHGMASVGSVAAGLGIPAGLYLAGALRKDPWQKQTANLAFEAVLHTTLVTTAVKGLSGRERPLLNNSRGEFGNIGKLNKSHFSFPSGHSGTAWALAAVVSERYPSRWVRILSYSLATTVSVSRITGKNHFYSDVFVGSYLGYKIGRWVVRSHSAEKALH